MPSFRRLFRLVLWGVRPHAIWADPPRAAKRGASDTVEAWRDGLCVSVSWQPAKFRGQGTHTYRLSATRWYCDRDGVWRNTSSLHREDLAGLAALVTECVQKLE